MQHIPTPHPCTYTPTPAALRREAERLSHMAARQWAMAETTHDEARARRYARQARQLRLRAEAN